MARVEIFTGPERRRSWSEEQKRAIVAAAFAPGAIVADVARRAAVCAGQIYRWRQELGHAGSGFSQVVIAAMADGGDDRAAQNPQNPAPAIEIEFTGAARLRILALTPPELAAAVIRALRR
jgi:transposase